MNFTGLWDVFVELVATPFRQMELIWGIVPLYFALGLNELTSSKANHRTALQTGFSFIWAGAHWLHPYFRTSSTGARLDLDAMLPINLLVTGTVMGLGIVALASGLRRKFPKHMSFLGHTRFANYFTIMLYPLQAQCLTWTWDRVIAIASFALPVWLVLHFGLMPLREHR